MKKGTASKTSKTLNTFSTLSAEEVKNLGKFVRSPYFTSSKHLPRILDYLRKYHQKEVSKLIDKEKLSRFLFPQAAFNVKKIRDLLSDFSLLMDQFLVVQKTQHNSILNSQLKIEAFGERNLYDRFETETDALKNHLLQTEQRGAHYDLHFFNLNAQHYLHPDTSFKAGKVDIEAAMQHLDRFFITSKLRYACELINRSKNLQEEHRNILFLEECLDLAEQQSLEKKELIRIYKMMIQLLRKEDLQIFTELKNLFFEFRENISSVEQRALFLYLVNLSNRRIKLGDQNYQQELFGLYQKGLGYDLCFLNKKITDTTFINISNLATGLKKFSWGHDFIEQYQEHLDKKIKESAVTLATAMVFFGEGKHVQVLDHLEKLDFPTDRYKLWMRSLKAKTLYELFVDNNSYFNLLTNFLQSFDQFVRTNKTFSESHKRPYLNCIAVLKKMTKPKVEISAEKKAKLKREILGKEQLVVRAWLLEKVEQL